jgi:hypothetical protein
MLRKLLISVTVFALAFFIATVLNIAVRDFFPHCHRAIASGLITATMIVLLLCAMRK